MRNLICWICGKTIVTGKFLHCTACGVNFGEECFHFLHASLSESGAVRTEVQYGESYQPPSALYPEWINLGEMAGDAIFAKYLLELKAEASLLTEKETHQVLVQCSNCKVDVDYRVADAGLYWRLKNVQENQETTFTLGGTEIVQYQHIQYVSTLDLEKRLDFHRLVKSGLPDQLEIINMVMGSGWEITNLEEVQDTLGFEKPAPDLVLRNQL